MENQNAAVWGHPNRLDTMPAMQGAFTIGDTRFELVIEKSNRGTSVYRGAEEYLRIGDPSRIAKDILIHRSLEEQGYPVPRLLRNGIEGDYAYYVEESLGSDRLGDIFKEDCRRDGTISAAHFQTLLSVLETYAEAQYVSLVPALQIPNLIEGTYIEDLVAEMEGEGNRIRTQAAFYEKELSVYPLVITHGDLNAQNMFAKGVIDLEHVFLGPFGYDLMTPLVHIEQFLMSGEHEFSAQYHFSAAQYDEYVARVDSIAHAHHLPPFSEHREAFTFFRAAWSAVHMHEWPKLQAWRYDRLRERFLGQKQVQ